MSTTSRPGMTTSISRSVSIGVGRSVSWCGPSSFSGTTDADASSAAVHALVQEQACVHDDEPALLVELAAAALEALRRRSSGGYGARVAEALAAVRALTTEHDHE